MSQQKISDVHIHVWGGKKCVTIPSVPKLTLWKKFLNILRIKK